jgi:hypothetical protein
MKEKEKGRMRGMIMGSTNKTDWKAIRVRGRK